VTFQENVGVRFSAYGWQVIGPIDGNNIEAIDAAIRVGEQEAEHPTLIICKTIIGYGSPNKANTGAAHGEPLGVEEVKLTKENLGWPTEPDFYIPDEALAHFRQAVSQGAVRESEWDELLASYRKAHPEKAAEFERMMAGRLPEDWDKEIPAFTPEDGPVATRNAGGTVLNCIFDHVPDLVGGSADLAPSTKTWLKSSGKFGWDKGGHNLQFGIREHAMGSIALGMAHHGGVIPFTATFLVFSDYMRPPIRLASLSEKRVVFVFTHDSIGLGEDGPTHQPVEQLAALRAIPGVRVFRPADATEVAETWRQALLRLDGPSVMALSRQKLPILDRTRLGPAEGVAQGGYILRDADGTPRDADGIPQIILIATGSEVHLALSAADALGSEGLRVRVVSMPCWELFDEQSQEYKDSVLPPGVSARLAIEAGVTQGWWKYVGTRGDVIGLDRFGASAPGSVVMDKLGFNVDNVVARAKALLG
jgi:transketolase